MTSDPRIPCSPAPLPASAGARPHIDVAPTTGDDKAALRKALLAARGALGPAHKSEWDAAISAHVLAWWRAHAQDADAVLAVYWPLRGEPDLAPAYAELARDGVRLALPVVVARDAALGFALWTPGEAMVKDAMGVAVPAALRHAPAPAALLVPCVGFYAARFRLGYGGGYYDRTLAASPRPLTAGVAYASQCVEFASDMHDIALDVIITEGGTGPAD